MARGKQESRVWFHVPPPLRVLAIAIAWAAFPGQLCAEPLEDLEYRVRAAFLLNFTKFVEWPSISREASDTPISICVLGDDPFGTALDRIVEGESVGGRRITVQRLREPAQGICSVAYIARSWKDPSKVLTSLGPGVLTVGEGDGFLHEGGMIAFVIDRRRVRFDVNQTAVHNAALKLSSRLLTVARSVHE